MQEPTESNEPKHQERRRLVRHIAIAFLGFVVAEIASEALFEREAKQKIGEWNTYIVNGLYDNDPRLVFRTFWKHLTDERPSGRVKNYDEYLRNMSTFDQTIGGRAPKSTIGVEASELITNKPLSLDWQGIEHAPSFKYHAGDTSSGSLSGALPPSPYNHQSNVLPNISPHFDPNRGMFSPGARPSLIAKLHTLFPSIFSFFSYIRNIPFAVTQTARDVIAGGFASTLVALTSLVCWLVAIRITVAIYYDGKNASSVAFFVIMGPFFALAMAITAFLFWVLVDIVWLVGIVFGSIWIGAQGVFLAGLGVASVTAMKFGVHETATKVVESAAHKALREASHAA